MSKLNFFEQSVIHKLLDHPLLSSFRQQISAAEVMHRTFTETGFFVNLHVEEEIKRTKNLNFQLGDVTASFESLEFGVDFLLYVKDGVIDMLEGFTYDESLPKTMENAELMFLDEGERSLSEIPDSIKSILIGLNP